MSKKIISSRDEDRICDLIIDFSNRSNGKKLTWGLIERAAGFSRQSLSVNIAIKSAYDLAKGKPAPLTKSKDEIIEEQSKEIERLNVKLSKKRATITNYEEKFVRWMSNASEYLTENELNRAVQNSMKTELRLRTIK